LNWKQWLLPAALATAAAVASVFTSVDYVLVNAVIAVGVIVVAWMVAQAWTGFTPRAWLLVAAVGLAAGVAALIADKSYEDVCVAINASDQRVVIGTELTDAGKQFKKDNPAADNNELLESVGEKSPDSVWTPASIERCRMTLMVSGALWIPLFGIAVIAATSAVRLGRAVQSGAPRPSKPRVFISYTHDDTATAMRLKGLLQQHKIEVIIDTENMAAGERITEFIDRSIQDCDVVLSLISGRSLVSPWVASEAIAGLARNRWGQEVALIACYLDEDWMRPEFRLECTVKIDERLRRLEELIGEYSAKRIDPADLNEERSRLYSLRNSLGDILARLKDSLTLDVREGKFEGSGARLVKAVTAAGRGGSE
jgi:hypothetical protein